VEILTEAGLTGEEIEHLTTEGIVCPAGAR
jgi:hypothetical protein